MKNNHKGKKTKSETKSQIIGITFHLIDCVKLKSMALKKSCVIPSSLVYNELFNPEPCY